jgi:N6-L-threonylcarbamoyladenine synthase
MKGNALDFSFSGLKTAVLRWVEQHDMADEIAARRGMLHAGIDELRNATPQRTLDLLASFQHAVVRELLRHVAVSAEGIGAQSAIISGGVACNAGLRDAARTLLFPTLCIFPTPGPLHRQRRHDRRRGISKAHATRVRRFHAQS